MPAHAGVEPALAQPHEIVGDVVVGTIDDPQIILAPAFDGCIQPRTIVVTASIGILFEIMVGDVGIEPTIYRAAIKMSPLILIAAAQFGVREQESV